MNLSTWIILLSAIAAILLLKRLSLLSPAAARAYLKQGALVIDVRTEGEFRGGHVPGAINIPLGHLGDEIGRRAPDKGQPLLLHCLSGGRSAMAKARLKQLGYRNVFNLGSYGRAARIVGAQG